MSSPGDVKWILEITHFASPRLHRELFIAELEPILIRSDTSLSVILTIMTFVMVVFFHINSR